MPRRVVLVSGAPGAGKSTLAVPLAAELGFMLLRKDQIKEKLHDALFDQTRARLPSTWRGRANWAALPWS
jgi:predicted kinase